MLDYTLFGESHGPVVGVLLRHVPAGIPVDALQMEQALLRRRSTGGLSTARRETDQVQILSGVFQGHTTGMPLVMVLPNSDVHSQDYDALRTVARPGHADYTARVKAKGFADYRGGGHFSGRLTAPLCIAGGVCLQMLAARGVRIAARIVSIADVTDESPFSDFDVLHARSFPVSDLQAGAQMQEAILVAKSAGDSVGGVIECMITGAPAGLGEPMFGGMENRLSQLLFAIPAVKGVEFGAGFGAAKLRGSENNDPFTVDGSRLVTTTNHAGGILGGITTGMPIVLRAAFKPTPSIALTQKSVDLRTMEQTDLRVQGRHDPCIVPRAVPCVEAAAAIAVLDAMLEAQKTEVFSWN